MLETSQLYQDIFADPRHRKEYKIRSGGVDYEHRIVSISTSLRLFAADTLSVGGTVSGQISLVLRDVPEFPLAAKIELFVRLVSQDGSQASEWLPHGVFFIDTRSVDYSTGTVAIEGYDVMMLAERPWDPDQRLNFPLPMNQAVAEFCRILGCELDPRTEISSVYTIGYPTSDPDSDDGEYYTIREILGWIAAAHAGNWIVTYEGKLLLIGIDALPEETWYLVTEYGAPIDFGGTVILVNDNG